MKISKDKIYVTMVLPYDPNDGIAGLELGTLTAAKSINGSIIGVVVYCRGKGGYFLGQEVKGRSTWLGLALAVLKSGSAIVHWMEIWPGLGPRILQLLSIVALSVLGRRNILTIATFGNFRNRSPTYFERRILCACISRLVGLCDSQISEFLSLGAKKNKIRKCPRGIEEMPPRLNQQNLIKLRKRLGIDVDKIVVSYIGRFVMRKRLIDLISVWENAIDLHQKSTLVFVGSGLGNDDSIEVELKQRIDKSNSPVSFHAWTNTPHDYYAASDIFVILSEREGQPHALISAMMAGLSVIVRDAPGLKELVQDRVTGLLVSNSADAVPALRELIADQSLRENLGVAAALYARESHSISKVQSFHMNLYLTIDE